MDKVDTALRILGIDHLTRLPFVQKISEKTNVPPSAIVFGSSAILILACLSVYFGTIMTYFTMFLFPAYDTFKAIENKDQANQNRLLTYWMVFGTFFALDNVFQYVFSFLPFFHLIRLALLFAFYSRSINGAEYFYQYVQKPAFERVSGVVDEFLTPVEVALTKAGDKFQKTQKTD